MLDVGPVRVLLEAGHVVVAAGGGGIPVVREPDGRLRGVEAVIDKDLTAALLARTLGADVLVIATDVDHAAVDWGTAAAARARPGDPRRDAARTPPTASSRAGSMGPKVDAASRFVAGGGPRSVITSLTHIADAVAGRRFGTVIEPPTQEGTHRARRHRGPQGPAAHRVRRQRAGRSSSTTA